MAVQIAAAQGRWKTVSHQVLKAKADPSLEKWKKTTPVISLHFAFAGFAESVVERNSVEG
jgi:hypothetical protein